MAIAEHLMTAAELLQTPGLGRCELVEGELIQMTPAGFEHGRIAAQIGGNSSGFCPIAKHSARVTGTETGFRMGRNPDTVRAPDAAFIRQDRVPPTPIWGFFPAAPDLAVEVLSPGDRASEVLAKARYWLRAGCRLVWVIDPQNHRFHGVPRPRSHCRPRAVRHAWR